VTEFKVGDKIAAAVLSYKRAALRVGVITKIHDETTSIHVKRFTIRDEKGQAHVVSSSHATHIERDEHHTMQELYLYRMLYNAWAIKGWTAQGVSFKSWRHADGELCFGGGWFIVGAFISGEGWVTNHYKAEAWDLFDAPEADFAPEWDGHTPAEAAERLLRGL
jgi:hypothetical protein